MTHFPQTPRPDPPPDGGGHDPDEGDHNRPPSSGLSRFGLFVAIALGFGLLLFWLSSRYPDALESRMTLIRMAALVGLLVFIGSSVFAARRLNLGKAARDLAIWAGILVALVAVYGFRGELSMVRDRVLGEFEPHRAVESDRGELVFRRGGDGHFYVTAELNGTPTLFLVDTGASDIVLSPQDAKRLGYDLNRLSFDRSYQTANGSVMGASVVLDTISVGPLRYRNVGASVNRAPMTESLLGMTFLDRLSGYEFRGDSLILRP